MTQFNRMQILKRRFFAMRNGIIADRLRRAGSGFRIIFGLNVPQLMEIASEMGHDKEMGRELWNNRTTRESMLLATMLLRPDDLNDDEVSRMIGDVEDVELADMLCHRLLRNYGSPTQMAAKLAESDRPMDRYIALRLMSAFVRKEPGMAKSMADKELQRNDRLTAVTARMLSEEADFCLEEGE